MIQSSMIEYLLEILKTSEPQVCATICWSLSRYAKSLFKLDKKGDFFKRYLQELMLMVMSINTLVQEAACTSVILLIAIAEDKLFPYANDILQVLVNAIQIYKPTTLTRLYNAIAKLIEAAIQSDDKEDLLNVLFEKWNEMKDDDKVLCSLMECIKCILLKFGLKFGKWIQLIIKKILRLLSKYLALINEDIDTVKVSIGDTRIVIKSIEIFNAICELLKENVERYLIDNNVLELCKCKDVQVRQYGCFSIGVIARTAKNYFKNHLLNSIPILVSYIHSNEEVQVIQSCCKSLCDIILTHPELTPNFSNECAIRFINILQGTRVNRELGKSIGTLIGILSLYDPTSIIPYLDHVLRFLCASLKELDDREYKQLAFKYLFTYR